MAGCCWQQGHHLESVALIQTKGNDGLDKCSRSRSREEWLDSGFNLQVDAIVFLIA